MNGTVEQRPLTKAARRAQDKAIRDGGLNPWSEGDARLGVHAHGCGDSGCPSLPGCAMYCRCWCHDIAHHQDGSPRPDADHIDQARAEAGYR